MDLSNNKVIVWFETLFETVWSNRTYLLGTIAGAFLLVVGFIGYRYYDSWAQAGAHKAFVAALKYHDAAVTGKKVSANHNGIEFETDQEKWTKTADVFKQGYNNHRRSGLASMFQAYYADALARLGKHDEAVQALDDAISIMPQKDMKDFYAVKRALLKIDSTKQTVQQEGIAELRKIADDASHFANEAGLFYLGYYF